MIRKRCPECKIIKPMDKRQKCCSHSCHMKRLNRLRGTEWYSAFSRQGAEATKRILEAKRDARFLSWIERKGPMGAMRFAYKMGYYAGYKYKTSIEKRDAAQMRTRRVA